MTKQASMHEETDEDLFLYMACAETAADRPLADGAYAEIHRRYVKRLYARCLRMVSSYPDPETMAMDLASAALARAYEKAEKYQTDPEDSLGAVRTFGWLCKIAENIFRDHIRNPERPGPLNVIDLDVNAEMYAPEDFASLFCEDQSPPRTLLDYQLVARAFDVLDARTKTVLIETLVHRGRSPGRTHMLRGTTTALAKRLETSTANLRLIRRKGLRQINAYVEQHKNELLETNHE